MSFIIDLFWQIWGTLGLMAPYLLLGYLIAGGLSIFVTPDLVERHLGKPGLASTVKAALFGMPLPLCSCGVLPVTASLRKHGAGRGATASFLVSTPTTGVDSILVAWGMLGPFFALYRAALAVVLGIFAGTLADRFGSEEDDGFVEHSEESAGSCCSGHAAEGAATKPSFPQRLRKALTFGFLTLPKDIGKPLLIGIAIAGIIAALIQANVITPFLGGGIISMLVMLAVGLPLYVCATASVPMALAFIYIGATPGAALVFLIVGPATNAATIGILWKMIGKRSTIATVGTLIVGSLVAGLLLDAAWSYFNVPPIVGEDGGAHSHLTVINHIAAVLLLIVQFYSMFRIKINGWLSGAVAAGGASCCHTEGAAETAPVSAGGESCCSHTQAAAQPVEQKEASCCHSANEAPPAPQKPSCCSDKAEGAPQKPSCCSAESQQVEQPPQKGSCCCGTEQKPKTEPPSDCCKDDKPEDKSDKDEGSGGCCCGK